MRYSLDSRPIVEILLVLRNPAYANSAMILSTILVHFVRGLAWLRKVSTSNLNGDECFSPATNKLAAKVLS